MTNKHDPLESFQTAEPPVASSPLLLLTIPLSARPTRITLRLSEDEAKQLALLTALQTLEAKKRVTTRACIADILDRSVTCQVNLPKTKTVAVLPNEAVAHRISLPTNEGLYAAMDALRGLRTIKVDRTGMDLQEKIEYGDADLIREALKLEYERRLHELQKQNLDRLVRARAESDRCPQGESEQDMKESLPRERCG